MAKPCVDPHKRKFLARLDRGWVQCNRQALRGNAADYRWFAGRALNLGRPQPAANIALALCAQTEQTHWANFGLPGDLSICVERHYGSAFKIPELVIDQRNHTGWHVIRTACMEAITAPDCPCASEQFAAIADCLWMPKLTFAYAGTLPLAKAHGRFQMYLVQRG